MEIGRLRIGVRCSSPTGYQALRTALAAHLVDDPEARINYSVREAEADGEFHLLYWGGVVVVRTLDRARLVRGLLTYLFGHGEPPAETLRADALVLVRNGTAVLGPAVLRYDLARIERRLTQQDYVLLDAPFAHLDPQRGELVVPSLPDSVNRSALKPLTTGNGARRQGLMVEPGRYPLTCWAFMAGDETRSLSRGEAAQLALASAMRGVLNDAEGTLAGLGNLLGWVPAVTVPTGPPVEVVRALISVIPTD